MGVFKFALNKGKEIIADRNQVAERAIRKEVEDLGLDDDLGNDFKVSVDGRQVKLEGQERSMNIAQRQGTVELKLSGQGSANARKPWGW